MAPNEVARLPLLVGIEEPAVSRLGPARTGLHTVVQIPSLLSGLDAANTDRIYKRPAALVADRRAVETPEMTFVLIHKRGFLSKPSCLGVTINGANKVRLGRR